MTNLMVVHGNPTQAASPYNPITQAQLEASGLAYLALGHIHQASGLLRCGKRATHGPAVRWDAALTNSDKGCVSR